VYIILVQWEDADCRVVGSNYMAVFVGVEENIWTEEGRGNGEMEEIA